MPRFAIFVELLALSLATGVVLYGLRLRERRSLHLYQTWPCQQAPLAS